MTTLTMPDDIATQYLGIQHRSAVIDALDEDERVITMRAVPYEVEARLGPELVEIFDRGAFARSVKDPSRVKLFSGHSTDGGKIVGQAIEVEDRSDGLWLQTRVSKTEAGDELLTLAQDKVLDEASIEFAPMRDMMTFRRRGTDTVVRHRRGHLRGVALVPHGAYSRNAIVTAVRDVSDKLIEEKLAKLRLLNH